MKHKTDVSFNKTDCLFITLTICQWYGKGLSFISSLLYIKKRNQWCLWEKIIRISGEVFSERIMLSVNAWSFNEVQAKHQELNSDDVWIPQGNSKS